MLAMAKMKLNTFKFSESKLKNNNNLLCICTESAAHATKNKMLGIKYGPKK